MTSIYRWLSNCENQARSRDEGRVYHLFILSSFFVYIAKVWMIVTHPRYAKDVNNVSHVAGPRCPSSPTITMLGQWLTDPSLSQSTTTISPRPRCQRSNGHRTFTGQRYWYRTTTASCRSCAARASGERHASMECCTLEVRSCFCGAVLFD